MSVNKYQVERFSDSIYVERLMVNVVRSVLVSGANTPSYDLGLI